MFSIIIPTHNRAHILRLSLPPILKMKGIETCELFIVDDGSTDSTHELLQNTRRQNPRLNITVLSQKNSGPGAARNTAVAASEMGRVLFIDDDVLPDPDLLSTHRDFLDKGFSVSQGILHWHPDIADSRVITFMESRKMQFSFDAVKPNDELSYLNIYTANLAVEKKVILTCGLFDDSLTAKRYAFEDTALGFNIHQAGYRIGLNKKAVALHYHPLTEDELVGREYKVGYSAGILMDKYPKIAQNLRIKQKTRFSGLQAAVFSPLLKLRCIRNITGYSSWMRIRCRESFIRGFNEYKKTKS